MPSSAALGFFPSGTTIKSSPSGKILLGTLDFFASAARLRGRDGVPGAEGTDPPAVKTDARVVRLRGAPGTTGEDDMEDQTK